MSSVPLTSWTRAGATAHAQTLFINKSTRAAKHELPRIFNEKVTPTLKKYVDVIEPKAAFTACRGETSNPAI